IEAAVFPRQQIDAGDLRMNGGGGATGDFRERIVRREGLGDGAAADVGAPVELISTMHAHNVFADDEQADVVAFVRDELLQVEHRAELSKHLEGAESQVFVVQTRDTAAFTAEE